MWYGRENGGKDFINTFGIEIAKTEGGKCVLGGGPAAKEEGGGEFFVKPTIFTGVDNKMRIAQEEVFGSVLAVIKFKDEEDAIRIANDIAFGLGAGVWTQSINRAHKMAKHIRAGTVWINSYRAVSFMMPFGGYKASGLGRENGVEAIEGYLQTRAYGSTTDLAEAIVHYEDCRVGQVQR